MLLVLRRKLRIPKRSVQLLLLLLLLLQLLLVLPSSLHEAKRCLQLPLQRMESINVILLGHELGRLRQVFLRVLDFLLR